MRLPGPDALRHPDDTRLTDGMDYTRYDALLGELVSRGFVALSIDMLPFTTMPSAQRGLHAGYGHPWWDMDPLLCADYDWAAFGMMLADAWLPWFWEHRRILGSGLGRFFIGHSMSAGPVANAALQTNATAFGLLGPAFVDRPPEGTSQVPLMVLIGDDDWVNGFGNMQAWTEYEELSESYENLAVGIVGKQVGHWDYTQGRIWACYGPNVDGRGDPCCVLGPRTTAHCLSHPLRQTVALAALDALLVVCWPTTSLRGWGGQADHKWRASSAIPSPLSRPCCSPAIVVVLPSASRAQRLQIPRRSGSGVRVRGARRCGCDANRFGVFRLPRTR